MTDAIGYLAATPTTAAFTPQAWLTLETKRADSVSMGMYSIFTAGVALWLVYALILGAWPIVVASAIALALFILVTKLRYG